MSFVKPFEFIEQVKKEASKVTWSSRRETMMSTIVVLIMVIISSLFFLLADGIIFRVIQFVLGF